MSGDKADKSSELQAGKFVHIFSLVLVRGGVEVLGM